MIDEEVRPEWLMEARVFQTTPKAGCDRVLLKIATPTAEHWFALKPADFFVLADTLHKDAECLRAEAAARTEAVVKRLGLSGIES